jgi:hypothetical protein
MSYDPKVAIPERNRQILQMRKEGVQPLAVARRFKLSPSRIDQIEKRDAADKATAQRRAKLREAIRSADDPDKMRPVKDLLDAIGLPVVTKKSLIYHFRAVGQRRVSLREFMNMSLDAPVEGFDFMMSPLLKVRGVGKKGFWCVVNGLTGMDLGTKCNLEWQERLIKVKEEHQVTGATPYSTSALWRLC